VAEFRFLGRCAVPQTGKRNIACGASIAALAVLLLTAGLLHGADIRPLIPDSLLRTILSELSVDNAMEQTATIAAHARYPNSQEFFDTAEIVASRAREYGLRNVRIERFPQDEPMWDQQRAALTVAGSSRKILAALAQHSADGDFTAQLVDADLAGGDNVRGKVALTDDEPDAAWRELGKQGPKAIVSDAQGEYFGRRTLPDAILWSMAPPNVVALMISPRSGSELRGLLKNGPVTVNIVAKARRFSPGAIGMVMGQIPGAVSGQDIVLAAHLDHQFPGANDNASGDGTLLELVRTINHLIAEGKIPKLHRTIRFWWTTEIDSEEAWFRAHPEDTKNILLSIVLDQAGGERGAENNFIAILNPEWLPSYADDLIESLADYVRERYAPAEHEPDPLLVAKGGGHQSLRTVYWEYQPITDEVAFETEKLRIPGISLAVPSLNLIHTNLDTVDRLDPTWMKRSALLTLAPALYLANAGPAEARAILAYTAKRSAARLAGSEDAMRDLPRERKRLESLRALDPRINLAQEEARLEAVAKAVLGRR
jgi:hypothetical protein